MSTPPQRFEVFPVSPVPLNPQALRPVITHLEHVLGEGVVWFVEDETGVPALFENELFVLEVHDINSARRVRRLLQAHRLGALPCR